MNDNIQPLEIREANALLGNLFTFEIGRDINLISWIKQASERIFQTLPLPDEWG